jgi:hypothetical protein
MALEAIFSARLEQARLARLGVLLPEAVQAELMGVRDTVCRTALGLMGAP